MNLGVMTETDFLMANARFGDGLTANHALRRVLDRYGHPFM
jgi:hypothetical protein